MLKRRTSVWQRYLVPRPLVSLYHLIRSRALVSTNAKVQFTSRITFGRGTVVKPYAIVTTQGGRVDFGPNCAVGNFSLIGAGTSDLRIGANVRIGPHVTILGSQRNSRRKDVLIVDQGYTQKPVEIGDDVLIGAGVIVHNGCRVGDGAVITAGSIVASDIPPYSIVFGTPARVVWRRT